MRAFLVTLLLMTGCATVRPVALDEGRVAVPPKAPRIDLDDLHRILGYVTRDSVDHPFKGFVERRGDSLQFSRDSTGAGIARRRELAFALPARDVIQLRILRPPPTGPLLAMAMAPIVVALFAYGMAMVIW